MSDGQWRVFGLIAFLLALELLAHPDAKTWLGSFFGGFVTIFKQAAGK